MSIIKPFKGLAISKKDREESATRQENTAAEEFVKFCEEHNVRATTAQLWQYADGMPPIMTGQRVIFISLLREEQPKK